MVKFFLFGCVCQPTINEYDDDDDDVLRYGGSAESADTYVCQYSVIVDRRDCVSEARYMDKIKQLPAQRVCERGFMLSK